MGQTQQSQIVYAIPFGSKNPGESHIYKNANTFECLHFKPEIHINTLQDVIESGHKQFAQSDFVGSYDKQTGKYQYVKYNQVYNEAKALGSAVQQMKLFNEIHEYKDFKMKIIGIYSKNRTEWNVTDMACVLYGYTTVPLYDTFGSESISHVLQNSSISSLFCSQQSAEIILKTEKLHLLKNLILYDKIEEALIEKIKQKGLNYYDYEQLICTGNANILPLATLKPDDIFTFSYTSGTTGLPKGAMLSHKNLVAALSNFKLGQLKFHQNDVQMCYLPLAHIMQRGLNIGSWYTGMKIAFFGGNIQKLKEDFQVIRPTVFVSVPRLFNRFYDLIQEQFKQQTGFANKLIENGINTKLENLKNTNSLKHYLYDTLVFNKIKNIFGGRIKICITASAPLSKVVLDFFKIALGAPFLEIYGQTEGTGFEFITQIEDKESGHVGGVCNSLELKLVDVPDMNYFSTDKDEQGNATPRGEICVRGPTVFAGYYKDEEKTKETIDDDGWLHSGDVGQILPNGALKIIDRKKNIFKLSQGEYVAPEKVENIYQRARGVAEIFVYGDSLQNYCVAIIVPNPDEIKKIAKELNIQSDDVNTLCANEQMINFYQKSIFDQGKKEGLATFEQAIKVYLEPVSMLIHECLTSSFKLQRNKAKIHFKNVIQQLYSKK
ncbi:hypothetical protein IMG5_168640 [Ichthyophthirius multifiliis]|uniref:AMP-dependent synthetase/ligase domain-containing protein n=1 Tax=Ichthyophthirius multifiliis TaxID=5932 RepID=G0R161_ICHMU|nr:hypothetical protein IMG5_168640 [Ichthyophthirius multifiliis]EGR28828.1 hypothetical protein IMG5_168640 [Ichthyophthirius multifiliis]|eukprot:XP_004030064.1 hypothetical protein IMG5_168640 [Ichthyophthirius multifiliis]